MSDQSLIDAGLAGIDPAGYPAALRSQVADLLAATDDAALSFVSGSGDAVQGSAGNVVAFARPVAGQKDPNGPSPPGVGFADIGGLDEVKAQMRRKIIMPFKNPGCSSTSAKSGGGILLYGPPGCGKTLLARAPASECDARFFNVPMSEVLSPYIGVAE